MKLVIDERQAGFRSGRQTSSPAIFVHPEGKRHQVIATFNVRADGSDIAQARKWAELFVAAAQH